MGQAKRKETAEAAAPVAEEAAPLPPPADQPQGLSRRGWLLLGGALVLLNMPVLHYFLLRPEPQAPLTLPFSDDYSDPQTVATHYWTTGGHWRVVNGELLSPGVKNNPLWLKAKLPENVAVEFDVRSMSPEGDVKVEIFGDGSDHASGYVLIHGGWNNQLSIIARLDEHGPSLQRLQAEAQRIAKDKSLPSADLKSTGVFKEGTRMRVEASPHRRVELGRQYHWRIERRGSLLRWFIDNQLYMEFDDPFPLKGKGHDRFGFSSWEAQLFFDNLRIEPL